MKATNLVCCVCNSIHPEVQRECIRVKVCPCVGYLEAMLGSGYGPKN
jgi:hypothetical protein